MSSKSVLPEIRKSIKAALMQLQAEAGYVDLARLEQDLWPLLEPELVKLLRPVAATLKHQQPRPSWHHTPEVDLATIEKPTIRAQAYSDHGASRHRRLAWFEATFPDGRKITRSFKPGSSTARVAYAIFAHPNTKLTTSQIGEESGRGVYAGSYISWLCKELGGMLVKSKAEGFFGLVYYLACEGQVEWLPNRA